MHSMSSTLQLCTTRCWSAAKLQTQHRWSRIIEDASWISEINIISILLNNIMASMLSVMCNSSHQSSIILSFINKVTVLVSVEHITILWYVVYIGISIFLMINSPVNGLWEHASSVCTAVTVLILIESENMKLIINKY